MAAAIWNGTPHSLHAAGGGAAWAHRSIFFVDVNEFSMHLFYRNRLVRAYLGASNVGRNPHPFTGFAPDDDLMLNDLIPTLARHSAYAGPYPLSCTALNLVGGDDLAWQQRKAASFVYSPIYCGYDHLPSKREPSSTRQGYRPTADFSGPRGPHAGHGDGGLGRGGFTQHGLPQLAGGGGADDVLRRPPGLVGGQSARPEHLEETTARAAST